MGKGCTHNWDTLVNQNVRFVKHEQNKKNCNFFVIFVVHNILVASSFPLFLYTS